MPTLFNFTRLQQAATACLGLAILLAGLGLVMDGIDRSGRLLHGPQVDHNPLTAVYLADVRFSGEVPPSFAVSISHDLGALPLEEKKAAFFKIVLPLVARENAKIREERALVMKGGEIPDALWDKYDTKKGDLDTLKRRIDVIPASMVLAQAALESGWGTSRFAREGNNLFGTRTYNPDTPGITPDKANGFRVVKYASLGDSVGHYMLNLNTNEAYREFRKARDHMRAHGKDPDSRHLATRLTSYSEIPHTYGRILHDIINSEKLEDFDGIRLVGDRSGDS